jgi:tetratricopeptide (TPR) repeat protein
MPILRSVVAKECGKPGCKRQGLRVGVHEAFCQECGLPLASVQGWDPQRITLAVGGPVGLMLLAYGLAFFIAHQPRPLTDDSRKRLEAWVREVDNDRVVRPRKKAELDGLVERERLDPQTVAGFVAEAQRRLEQGRAGVENGLRFAAAGRYAEALREYQRAVENDPENATAWADLGVANSAAGREKEALNGFTKALQVDPGNWLAHYNLGMLWARRGDTDQALQHLEKAFAARPDPASSEHRSMTSDLRAAALPAAIRRDPRFLALLPGGERR